MGVKVPPKGSHGVPFPEMPSDIAKQFSRRQLQSFREQHGGRTQGGLHTLMLESIGAKSGELRYAMLGYIEEGPGSWLVIASLGGAARHPGWVYNLAKRPQATVEFGDGRRVDVEAETLAGDELEAAWGHIAKEAPEYPKYRSKTDRELPVVRLRGR
jgi:deazaflavin-dependent oxidoreductase (nitroreductase family)